jgi:hypothetical protein
MSNMVHKPLAQLSKTYGKTPISCSLSLSPATPSISKVKDISLPTDMFPLWTSIFLRFRNSVLFDLRIIHELRANGWDSIKKISINMVEFIHKFSANRVNMISAKI